MQRVHAGHREVERKKDLCGPLERRLEAKLPSRNEVLDEFLIVLVRLDAEKHRAEEHREQEAIHDDAAPALLCGMDGERHREAARDEHRRIDRAEQYVEAVAAGGEGA